MTIIIERNQAVALITMDRPPVNALDGAMIESLTHGFADLSADKAVHCIVLAATGNRAFSAGFDLRELGQINRADQPKRDAMVRRCYQTIRGCAVPVIAAIEAPAVGAGCVLASICDVRIASQAARFVLPDIDIGRCGGTAHLARHLPQGLLRRMAFTGDSLSAIDAWRVGFVEPLTEPRATLAAARDLAGSISRKDPHVMRMTKVALNRVEFMVTEEGYEMEQVFTNLLRGMENPPRMDN